MTNSELRKSEIIRRKVRELLAAKYSLAKIAKTLGLSYRHTKLIAEQEQPHERI